MFYCAVLFVVQRFYHPSVVGLGAITIFVTLGLFPWWAFKPLEPFSGNELAGRGVSSGEAQAGESSGEAQAGESSREAQAGGSSGEAQAGESSREAESGNSQGENENQLDIIHRMILLLHESH